MTLATDLQTIVTDTQSGKTDQIDAFLDPSGYKTLSDFLKFHARQGNISARIHVEIGRDPYHIDAGYATLTGELAIINSDAIQGVEFFNDVAWVFFNASELTVPQFEQVVEDLITYFETEGLTTTSKAIGAKMADFVLNW